MRASQKSSFALLSCLLALAAFSTGCEESDAPRTGEAAAHLDPDVPDSLVAEEIARQGSSRGVDKDRRSRLFKAKLDKCDTSHQFRKVINGLEFTLKELQKRRKDGTGPLSQKQADDIFSVLSSEAYNAADVNFRRDLAVSICYGNGPKGFNPSDSGELVKAFNCEDWLDGNAIGRTLGEAEGDAARQHAHDFFLDSTLSYAYMTLVGLKYNVSEEKQALEKKPPLAGLSPDLQRGYSPYRQKVQDALQDLEAIEAAVLRYRANPVDPKAGEQLQRGLAAIERLKKSAGSLYITIACDAQKAFTFLGKPGQASGRGSDLDVNPAGPAETQNAEERTAQPAQVGI